MVKIKVNSIARKVEVDNRIPLRYYYRIADNLLKQANVYREESNVIDLYIILLRLSSLVSETIPYHRDYKVSLPKERAAYKKRFLVILDELESLQPEFKRRVDELNDLHDTAQLPEDNDYGKALPSSFTSSLERPPINESSCLNTDFKQPAQSSWNCNSNAHTSYSMPIDKQFQKLSFTVLLPKKETLSRHSILGPNGLRCQWLAPSTETKVQYPSSSDLTTIEDSRLNPAGQDDLVAIKVGDPDAVPSTMASVLALDDGRLLTPAEESCSPALYESREDPLQLPNIRQLSPPSVLAQVHQEYAPVPPSKVADPRPGLPKSSQDSAMGPSAYRHIHIPFKMMDEFLRLALENTRKNLETCAVLAGSFKNRSFQITTLIIPKQESTSDSCQTLNEEEIFEVQDNLSLFTLGWIHTHPSQTCFMSSVDLHTHYSYQVMLQEAIAIVMAPTDTTSRHWDLPSF
ncbi:hypothetical protein L6164_013628 [Bauhinia variegata]|uniref:Uncharacterized protein n=1 Tax=Bauhinia variegata TaxID=167791 RepID=A0ACB9NEX4_BAUVA|nr:hypothetical protein L6164_013628 [Bauhinia variegata]